MSQWIFRELFIRSWWVIAFWLLCAVLYEQGLKNRELHYQQLKQQLAQLQSARKKALHLQENLQRELHSLDDPDWIELILKQELGLIAEGEQKIYFKEGK
jgi:hypothetical protein